MRRRDRLGDALFRPDAHYIRSTATGAEIVMGLTDQPYGSREYAARDPEGNVWAFGNYRPEPTAHITPDHAVATTPEN